MAGKNARRVDQLDSDPALEAYRNLYSEREDEGGHVSEVHAEGGVGSV